VNTAKNLRLAQQRNFLTSSVAIAPLRTHVHKVHNDLLTKRRQTATDSKTGTALLAYAKTGIDHLLDRTSSRKDNILLTSTTVTSY
jgi:hypothetical protein